MVELRVIFYHKEKEIGRPVDGTPPLVGDRVTVFDDRKEMAERCQRYVVISRVLVVNIFCGTSDSFGQFAKWEVSLEPIDKADK